ncbi:MAG: hypothetical protein NTV73_11225 [Hyphomicrobiales bacterium]|nr:hypothetical protein [Hyphomicrobiales bacterium]
MSLPERRAAPDVTPGRLLAYADDRIAAALAFAKGGLIRRDFRLAHLDMTTWFTSAELAELAEAVLVQHESARPFSAATQIYALDAHAGGWDMPARWQDGAGFSSREFERILAAGGRRGFYHHDAPSWQFFDPAAGIGVHTLPAPLDIPPWELGSPLRLFIHWAQAAAGRRLTHAATLGLNGQGALIVGASKSGKSGTTLAGILNGLESVGDDYVALDQSASLVAYSVFKTFKQDLDGLRRVGLDPAQTTSARLNWRGKAEFDASRLAPRSFVNRMEIQAILLPRIAHARRTRIEPATPSEAALALAPSAVLQLPGDESEGFRFFTSVAKRLPAFRVWLSEDAVETSDVIGSFLHKEVRHRR